jgi:hypothetical protein
VLDDMLNEAYSRDVCDLLTKDSHSRNISVTPITRNLFQQGRIVQLFRLMPSAWSFSTTCVARISLHTLPDKCIPKISTVCSRDNNVTRTYVYLLLDLAQGTDDRLRFQTKTFPSEVMMVYAPVKNGAVYTGARNERR